MKNKLTYFIVLILAFMSTASAITVEVVNTDPSPIVAGDYADITLRFTNDELDDTSEKKNVKFNLKENPLYKQIFPVDEKLNQFFSGEVYTRTFRVYFSDDIEQGTIRVPVVISYDKGSVQKNLDLFVQENALKPQLYIGNIETSPNELLPDTENNKLTVTLQNLGDKDAELVSVKLVPQDDNIKEAYAYSLRDSKASIEGGSETEFEFVIDVEEGASGILEGSLEINYRAEKAIGNTYETYTENIPFEIPITGAPFLEVESVELLSDFKPGTTENEVKITIRNTGEEEAEDVRVRVQPDISYPFVFEFTNEYVSASVKPGETATIIFTAEVVEAAEVRDYEIRVLLESLVSDTRYTQDDSITVNVTQEAGKSNNSIGMILIIGIIAVSLLFGLTRFVKRKKRVNKKK